MGEIAARSSGGRPPSLHGGDDAVRRAGPVCPAAGRHCRFLLADGFHPVGRHCRFFCALIASTPWGWHCRSSARCMLLPREAGACPRRCAATYLCGTFSIDRVSGHHTSSLFTIPSYFDKRPPSATRDGVGTAALGLTPQGLRHLRMALWDDGGFRPVRGAGVSPAAAGGNFAPCEARPGALPPGPLQFFEKN